jgi:superfamily II DNA helicase RecQ
LLLRDNRLSVLLFASPECIVEDVWIEMIQKLIADTLLKLVCVDEVHQFVEFGLTFRKSFMSLKDSLFKFLWVTESQDKDSLLHTILKVPLLFMSATMNRSLVDLLQKIVGIQLCSNNIYWGDATYFQKRNITISSNYMPQYFRNVKLSVAALMKKDNNAKVVICSNTAKKLQDMQCSFDDWFKSLLKVISFSFFILLELFIGCNDSTQDPYL